MVMRRLMASALLVSLVPASALAGNPMPEINPGMATGGLALLAVGAILLFERYRR